MSAARYNILNKLKAANATVLREPEVAEYYAEMTPTWESDVARLKHWAKTMRAVKTEIFLGNRKKLDRCIKPSD